MLRRAISGRPNRAVSSGKKPVWWGEPPLVTGLMIIVRSPLLCLPIPTILSLFVVYRTIKESPSVGVCVTLLCKRSPASTSPDVLCTLASTGFPESFTA